MRKLGPVGFRPVLARPGRAVQQYQSAYTGIVDVRDAQAIVRRGVRERVVERGRKQLAGTRDGVLARCDRVAAMVAFFPPIEFTTGYTTPEASEADILLGTSATEEEAKQASPVSYVSGDYPPTFLLHGTADQMVSFTTSRRMFDLLTEKGVIVEMHLYPHHTHEFVRLPSMMAPAMAEIALFLKRTVVDPEKYTKENKELNMFAR